MTHPRPASDRFFEKVDVTVDGCWLWTGRLHTKGYAVLRADAGTTPRVVYAHRFAYEFFVGSIPEGMQLDHLCRNRHCVRPDHLERVSSGENTLRALVQRIQAGVAHPLIKTHCKRGHELSDANFHVTPNGTGVCHACKDLRESARRARLRQLQDAS